MDRMINVGEIEGTLAEAQKTIASTPYAYAGGGALVREDLQAELVVMAPKDTPLRNRLKRVPGNGGAHAFYRMKRNADTSQGTFFGTTPNNAVFAKGGLPTDATETYEYVSFPYYNLGDVVQVAFQDMAQGRSFTDLLAQRKKVKMLNVACIEEYFIINGKSGVALSGGGQIFGGLIEQITGGGGQLEVSGNGQIQLGMFRDLHFKQWQAGGSPSCLAMPGIAKAILTAQVNQIYAIRQGDRTAMVDASGGISIDAYDFGYGLVDWVPSRYMVPDPYTGLYTILSLDEDTVDAKNDGNVIQMVDVDPLHSVPLARLATAEREVIYETTTLMVSAPAFQGAVTGLNFASQSAITG